MDTTKTTDISTILQSLMDDNHVNLTILHRNTGLPLGTLSRLLSDPTANPTLSTLLPIAKFFQISINQLIGIDLLPSESKKEGYKSDIKNWNKVPLITWDQIIHREKLEEDKEESIYIISDNEISESAYAVMVEEDDWKNFMKGSILIIDPALNPEHKDYIIVYKENTAKPSLKQLIIDEDRFFIKSLNMDVSPMLMNDSYKILGVLVQIKMDTK